MATAPPFTFLIWQPPGEIAAIVIGTLAGVVLIGIAIFMIKRREPPPPPPEFKSVPPS